MSFIAPLFLLGLLGLALPWILHRLNEQDAPEVLFPSDQFLESTKAISSRKKRLRYLALLLVRILALLLLCLLFAEPVLRLAKQDVSAASERHAIVIDQSFSMRHGDRWNRAMTRLETIVEELPADSDIVLFGVETGLVKHSSDGSSKADIATLAQTLRPGHGSFGFGSLMRWLDVWAEKQTKPVAVHLLTDAQASAMPARVNALLTQHLASLNVENVGLASDGNVVLEAAVNATDSDLFEIIATARAYGESSDSGPFGVELRLGSEIVDTRSVAFDPEGLATVTFENLQRPPSGRVDQYVVGTSISDELSDDNNVLVPVEAMSLANVRIADQMSSTNAGDRVELLYLATALALDQRNRVTFRQLGVSGVAESTNVFFYLDDETVGAADSSSSTRAMPDLPSELREYLDQGGNVLYIFNGSASSKSNGGGVSTVDSSHALALDPNEWSEVNFYARDNLSYESSDTVLIRAEDGAPVLLERTLTKGKLLWLNASLNGADNNLPVTPAFVSFMQGLTDYFLRLDAYPSRLSIGESVKLGRRAQILDPDGRKMLDLAETAGSGSVVLDRPGVYTILDRQNEHTLLVATHPLESDTSAITDTALERWQQSTTADDQGRQVEGSDTSLAGSETDSPLSAGNRNVSDHLLVSMFKWLLPVCLVLVVLETILANRHLRVRRAQ